MLTAAGPAVALGAGRCWHRSRLPGTEEASRRCPRWADQCRRGELPRSGGPWCLVSPVFMIASRDRRCARRSSP